MGKYERLFEGDKISKRERVERTLGLREVDRVALHEQLSYNAGVIALYSGKTIAGFDYTVDDVCAAIRQTLDICFPPKAPLGVERYTTADGLIYQNDNWTTWRVNRFEDVEQCRRWLGKRTDVIRKRQFDPHAARQHYRAEMLDLQAKIGETVILNYSETGFCSAYDTMGLELFTFFYEDHADEMVEFMEVSTAAEIERVHAVADRTLSPVILLPEDFATKQGPTFSPTFLHRTHYPYVRRLVEAWHEHDVKVIYHSDGNYRKAIPDLIDCGVDGFYFLEPACGMDVVELKKTWPKMVWAGGVDGVDLMERGTPDQVRAEVHRHIRETDALTTGGMFVASSSEINPPIKPENFQAMVEAVGEMTNPSCH